MCLNQRFLECSIARVIPAQAGIHRLFIGVDTCLRRYDGTGRCFGAVGCRAGQAGFSLPIAVFILVIMALLAVGIAQLSSRSNLSATHEELSNRAFYAAESGAQWAMSTLFFDPGGSANRSFSDSACDSLGAPPVISGTLGLSGCTLTVTCVCQGLANCTDQVAGAANYYTVRSTGTCGSGQVQGIRTIEVGAKNED